ncbi:MAG: SURF1 family cytochrome oxidase biogenesis protein [Devosia sp.]
MSEAGATPRRLGFGFWSFILLMLTLTALFAMLGVWQLNRLAEKEARIATVDARLHLPPLELPPGREWVGLDPEIYAYRPITVTGTLEAAQTVLVFTSLSEPRGRFGGPGYWAMTPMTLSAGGVVFVNRGFVPQASAQAFLGGDAKAAAPISITGIALLPETAGPFTPGPEKAKRIDWVRDPARLKAMLDPSPSPLAEFTIDAPAGEAGALPQGGETLIAFPNNHFGYALTWFGFALLTPLLLIVWIVRQIRTVPKNIAADTPFH